MTQMENFILAGEKKDWYFNNSEKLRASRFLIYTRVWIINVTCLASHISRTGVLSETQGMTGHEGASGGLLSTRAPPTAAREGLMKKP